MVDTLLKAATRPPVRLFRMQRIPDDRGREKQSATSINSKALSPTIGAVVEYVVDCSRVLSTAIRTVDVS